MLQVNIFWHSALRKKQGSLVPVARNFSTTYLVLCQFANGWNCPGAQGINLGEGAAIGWHNIIPDISVNVGHCETGEQVMHQAVVFFFFFISCHES